MSDCTVVLGGLLSGAGVGGTDASGFTLVSEARSLRSSSFPSPVTPFPSSRGTNFLGTRAVGGMRTTFLSFFCISGCATVFFSAVAIFARSSRRSFLSSGTGGFLGNGGRGAE